MKQRIVWYLAALVACLAGAVQAQDGAPFVRTTQMKALQKPRYEGYEGVEGALAFAPDGSRVVLRGSTGSAPQLWQMGSAQPSVVLKSLGDTEPNHRLNYSNRSRDKVAFSPDGTMVAGVFFDFGKNGVLVWDAKTGKLLASDFIASSDKKTVGGQANDFAYCSLFWTREGPTIVTMSAGSYYNYGKDEPDCRVYVWDASGASQGRCSLKRKVDLKETSNRDLVFQVSPDGGKAATFKNGALMLWDTQSGVMTRRIDSPLSTLPKEAWKGFSAMGSEEQTGERLVFSRDGDLVMSRISYLQGSKTRRELRLWNLLANTSRVLQGSENASGRMAISPDGTLAATSDVRLWDTQSGALVGGAETPLSGYPIAFSSDNTLITGGLTIISWDVEKLRQLNGRIAARVLPGASAVRLSEADIKTRRNYDYTIKRASVFRKKEQGGSFLQWQIREMAEGDGAGDEDTNSGRVAGVLPDDVYYGEPERALWAIGPGARLFAVADWEPKTGNGLILMWDVASGRALPPLRVPKEGVNAIRFSPDGRLLATSSNDKRVRVWDARTGRLLQRLLVADHGYHQFESDPPENLGALAWSPDSKTLALPGDPPTPVLLWDVRTGKLQKALKSHDKIGVDSLSWSPDGRMLAAGGMNARVWDVPSGRLMSAFDTFYTGAQGGIGSAISRDVAFSRRGDRLFISLLAEGAYNSIIYEWDVKRSLRPIDEAARTLINPSIKADYARWPLLDTRLNGLAWSPRGDVVASSSRDGVRLWNATNSTPSRVVKSAKTPLRFGSDGTWTALSSEGGVARLDAANNRTEVWASKLLASTRPVAISPDSRLIAGQTYREDADGLAQHSDLMLWDAATGRVLKKLAPKVTPLNALNWSPDGKTVVGSDDDGATMWTIEGREQHLENVGDAYFLTFAVAPDNRTIAGGDAFGFVHLWDAASGKWLQTLVGTTGAITALAWSPDGKTLAGGGHDYIVRLWNVASGQQERVWTGHANVVTALSWSPDGATLASLALDVKVKLWRAKP